MNILMINTTDYRGGAAQVMYNLKNRLLHSGHRGSAFVYSKTLNDSSFIEFDKKIILNKWSTYSKRIIGKDIPSFLYLRGKELFRAFLANDIEGFFCDYLLKTEEYKNSDIVHLHNLHGYYFNLNLLEKISMQKPIVWTLHDMWAFTGHCSYSYDCMRWQTGCGQCPNLKIYPSLYWDNTKTLWNKKRKIYSNSKLHIVVPSLWLKRRVENSILKNQDLYVIPNGVDIEKLKQHNKASAREELNLPKDKKIIMFLAAGGSQDQRKGWQYIQAIKKRFVNAVFLCIGNKNKQEKEGNVIYVKYIDSKIKLAKYFSASDVFLFTSLAENFPLVILEAMACGTPIVSFDVGGVKEALAHKENGYIANYKDEKDLIKGIDYIFSLNNNEKKNISINSRKKVVEKYSLEIMTNNYIKLYKEILYG